MSYYTDLWLYRRRQAKKPGRRRQAEEGRRVVDVRDVHRRAGAGEQLPAAPLRRGRPRRARRPRRRGRQAARRARRVRRRARRDPAHPHPLRPRRRRRAGRARAPARRSTARSSRRTMLADIMSFVPFAGLRPVRALRRRGDRRGRREAASWPGFDIDVIFTPGHSPGHVTYSIARRAHRTSLVLRRRALPGLGRPHRPARRRHADAAGVDRDAARDATPTTTVVLPGHMGVTTLGAERATNPFLAGPAGAAGVSRDERQAPGAARHLRRAARAGARCALVVEQTRARRSSRRAGYRRDRDADLRGHRRSSRAASASRPTSSRRRCTPSRTRAGAR